MKIQELRIAAIEGIDIPDNLTEGSRFTITAELQISRTWQETIDVSDHDNPDATLPGGVIVGTILIGQTELT